MIPTVDDLRSDKMQIRFNDMFNPPGLTNFIGCVQTNFDLTGIRSLNFPPYGISDIVTAGLFVNDRYFPSTGQPITFTWYPDRIERESNFDGLYFKSITVLAVRQKAAVVSLHIENRSGINRSVNLRFGFAGGVTNSVDKWAAFLPPFEQDNEIKLDMERNALLFKAMQSRAFFLQGMSAGKWELTENGARTSINLKSGQSRSIYYIGVIGETANEVLSLFDALRNNPEDQIRLSREEWNAELKAVFTPENSRYSGSLPVLETKDPDVLKLYHAAVISVISFKRDNPNSVLGRTYDTLMPRYWQTVTFLWDYHLSSLVHALLDPAVMKKNLEQWMLMDIHHHFGIEYLRGNPVGPWYSVNDYAMCAMMNDYLRWSGDFNWLDEYPHDMTGIKTSKLKVSRYLDRFAHSWRNFRADSGLADYGAINNLLECVSTYIHEVASLNAANVFNLRFAADIHDMRGKKAKARTCRLEASEILDGVKKLYVDGKGFWCARLPQNKMVEVRHCYDFMTVIGTIGDDLSERQKSEMAAFCENELMTPAWIRALSPADDNVIFSVRPDHQWVGAYPAWPAQAVSALYKIGKTDLAFKWLKGLARSANQGPFGQAQFVDNVVDTVNGGARKAPPDFPYMTDWAVSGSGSWLNIIIEGIFGVKASLGNGISAKPCFGPFDPDARLNNLVYQGKSYEVSRKGLKEVKS